LIKKKYSQGRELLCIESVNQLYLALFQFQATT